MRIGRQVDRRVHLEATLGASARRGHAEKVSREPEGGHTGAEGGMRLGPVRRREWRPFARVVVEDGRGQPDERAHHGSPRVEHVYRTPAPSARVCSTSSHRQPDELASRKRARIEEDERRRARRRRARMGAAAGREGGVVTRAAEQRESDGERWGCRRHVGADEEGGGVGGEPRRGADRLAQSALVLGDHSAS